MLPTSSAALLRSAALTVAAGALLVVGTLALPEPPAQPPASERSLTTR